MAKATWHPMLVISIACFLLSVVGAAPSAAASLKVTSFPSGAQVVVDGLNTGKVTPMSIDLPEGDHTITVQIPGTGWSPDTRIMTIGAGTNNLSLTLTPTLTVGPPGPKGDKGDKGDTGETGPAGRDAIHPDPPCFDNGSRYVDCGNGTVTDTVTNLMWLKDAACLGTRDWAAASQAAAALKHGECGLTDHSSPGDWRLPTITEWEATVAQGIALGCWIGGNQPPPELTNDAGTGCMAAGPTSFTGVTTGAYWSSSSVQQAPLFANFKNLSLGGFSNFRKIGFGGLGVWPVRAR